MMDGLITVAISAMLVLLALTLRGIWPMMRLDKNSDDAMPYLFRGIGLLIGKVMLRAFWWDVLPVVLSEGTLTNLRELTGGRVVPNLMLSMLGILAALEVLRGIWRLIPTENRRDWSIWTAPFYPRRFRWRKVSK